MVSGIGRRRLAAQNDPTNAAYQKRRNEIIEAAGHVFKTKGFGAASLGDIAQYMNTDRANLYYYVASKEELLEGVVSKPVRANLERAQEILASDLSAPDKLRTLIVDLMVSYEQNFPFLYVYIQENLSQLQSKSAWAQEMKRINREYEKVVIAVVEQGQADGSIRISAPPWVISYGIIGLVAWTNRWYDPSKTDATAEQIAHGYADMVVSGIAPGAAPWSATDQGASTEASS